MLLFLIRHGQTEANVNGTYSGQTDVTLTEQGRAQAEALCPQLKKYRFDQVFTSDLTRAIDTQRLALPGREGIRTPLLREIDVGELAGRSISATLKEYGKTKGDYTRFGGESVEQMTNRLREFLTQLEKYPCECAVAFAHGGLIKSMLHIVMGARAEVGPVANGNCNVSVFQFDGNSWNLLAWNLMGIGLD